tara:strand:- start:1063 stop:1221 length:159 start_codon:yes stop_codon:yes gene_type:complete
MKYKNIRIIIVAAIAFTILSAGCSITVTRNYYIVKPKTLKETDRTTYVFGIA